MSKYFLVFKLI